MPAARRPQSHQIGLLTMQHWGRHCMTNIVPTATEKMEKGMDRVRFN